MADASDKLQEATPPVAAPAAIVERAATLVQTFPECFWYWHPDAQIRDLQDVQLVIEHLRGYGDHRAWRAAQALYKCLLQVYKKKP
jgi:hypothetical protein